MNEKNGICCDAKGNMAIHAMQGGGKSFFYKLLTIQAMKDAGYDVKEIKLDEKSDSFNPLDIGFSESTLEEKEQKLRNLLKMIKYDQNFILYYLQDMSFLDDKPEWKERATAILQEYVCENDRFVEVKE